MTDGQERLYGFIVCRSADGWSLHAHDATDEGIACGDYEAWLSGEYDADGEIPEWARQRAAYMVGETEDQRRDQRSY